MEESRNRSIASNSAAASAVPSARKRVRAGEGFGWVSGTSNTPFVKVSLRPDARSTIALPTRTVAVRPWTRVTRSASRNAGSPSTTRKVFPLVTRSIDKPSSGSGGPPGSSVESGALVAISTRSTVPPLMRSTTQERSRGVMSAGHRRLNADTVIRVPATPSARRGSGVEKSIAPDSAKPPAIPPRSPCSISNTRRTGSICARTATRSMISGGSRERSADANTISPRGMVSDHGAPASAGTSS